MGNKHLVPTPHSQVGKETLSTNIHKVANKHLVPHPIHKLGNNTPEGSGVLIYTSLYAGKRGVKVLFFVDLTSTHKSAHHLLMMMMMMMMMM